MQLRLERRLSQPRWLTVVVPIGSLVVAFVISGVVLLITGHNPLDTYRQLFRAAFTEPGSLTQTLITTTPPCTSIVHAGQIALDGRAFGVGKTAALKPFDSRQ